MSPIDNVTEESAVEGRDLSEIIREKIFNLPLLPQPQVRELFDTLDASLQYSINILLAKSNFVETYLSDVVSEVAASMTHGRTIYGGTSKRKKGEDRELEPEPEKGTPESVYKRQSDIVFLEQSINILHLLAHYQECDLSEAHHFKDVARDVLREIKFVRLVYEEVIERFLLLTKPYVAIAQMAVDEHNDMHDARQKRAVINHAIAFSDLHDQMEEIEEEVQVDRAYLYHLCLFIKKKEGEQRLIRDKIYKPYLRIVYKEAKRHATNAQQTLDNFQNGSTGLHRAISCYNLDKNVSFSSYSHWWVRQAILFSIKDTSNFVKLPVTTWQTYSSVEKKRAVVLAKTGDASLEVLAKETGHSVAKLKEMYESVRASHVHSLDYEVDETGKMLLIDVIPDADHEERERIEEIDSDVEARLATLAEDERWVLRLHYGMFGKLEQGESLTARDIMQAKIRQRIASVGGK